MPADKIPSRPTAFFGRRKGHRLRANQASLLSDLLPKLDFRSDPPITDLRTAFGSGIKNVRLEIGFGGGEHLVAEAMAFPDTGFIGCEPYINGMAKILSQIESRGLKNVRLFAGDALELLSSLPPSSLIRIDLIHPDPWPKRKHWKRRFVQDATIGQMARVLKPGGDFRFVTDIEDYCNWTLVRMLRSLDFSWMAARADDWRQPWPGYTMTRYGQKATREGRRAQYLIFRRKNATEARDAAL